MPLSLARLPTARPGFLHRAAVPAWFRGPVSQRPGRRRRLPAPPVAAPFCRGGSGFTPCRSGEARGPPTWSNWKVFLPVRVENAPGGLAGHPPAPGTRVDERAAPDRSSTLPWGGRPPPGEVRRRRTGDPKPRSGPKDRFFSGGPWLREDGARGVDPPERGQHMYLLPVSFSITNGVLIFVTTPYG